MLLLILAILVVVLGVTVQVTVTRRTARRVIVARLARYVGVVEVGEYNYPWVRTSAVNRRYYALVGNAS